MDFTGNDRFKHFLAVDPVTGVLTLTIKNESETVTIGTVSIEETRFRPLMAAFAELAKTFYPDNGPALEKARTHIYYNEDRAITEF